MSNPNLSSLFFMIISLTITSSLSFVSICKAEDASNYQTGIHRHGRLLGTSKNSVSKTTFIDNSRKIMNKPLEGMQPLKATGSDQQFNYLEGTHGGPKNWGSLSPDWKTCGDGKFQSPININVIQTQVIRADLKRAYKDAPAKLVNGYNNIGIEWLGDAGGIEMNGSIYKLYQCHWHMPSEHAIDGKRFDAELHLVHKNDKEQKAVIGILQAVGNPDPFIASLTEKIKMVGENEGIDLGKILASTISYGSKRYYRYIGSLTTPPCKEGVLWTILEKLGSISKDQINLIKGLHQRGFQENARPLQQLEGRPIWKFDMPDEKE